MILNKVENKLDQNAISKLSQEERVALAVQLLKDLKPLKTMADEAGNEFLSYLLDMAVLEVHSIAGGPIEPGPPVCGVCGFSNDMDSINETDEFSFEHY